MHILTSYHFPSTATWWLGMPCKVLSIGGFCLTDVFQGNLEWDQSSNTLLNFTNVIAGTHHVSWSQGTAPQGHSVICGIGISAIEKGVWKRKFGLSFTFLSPPGSLWPELECIISILCSTLNLTTWWVWQNPDMDASPSYSHLMLWSQMPSFYYGLVAQ